MSSPASNIRNVEIDLIARGYVHRHWRRGVMGTRVFAKDNERVVIVRNTGVDRHPPEDEVPTLENWFARLRLALEDLRKGARVTQLILFATGPVPAPQEFLDWCEGAGIKVQANEHAFPAEAP